MSALREWISVLQNTADSQLPCLKIASRKHAATMQLILADSLRSDAELRPVMHMVARTILPPGIAAECCAKLGQKEIMSKSQLSRSRLVCDCAYMLLWRVRNADVCNFAWYGMTDASPQGHREYQVTLLRKIDKAKLGEMFEAASRLYHLWVQDTPDSDRLRRRKPFKTCFVIFILFY